MNLQKLLVKELDLKETKMLNGGRRIKFSTRNKKKICGALSTVSNVLSILADGSEIVTAVIDQQPKEGNAQ